MTCSDIKTWSKVLLFGILSLCGIYIAIGLARVLILAMNIGLTPMFIWGIVLLGIPAVVFLLSIIPFCIKLFLAFGQYSMAEQFLKAVRRSPLRSYATLQLADCYLREGKYVEAEKTLRVLETSQKVPPMGIYPTMAKALIKQNKLDEAESLLNPVITRCRKNVFGKLALRLYFHGELNALYADILERLNRSQDAQKFRMEAGRTIPILNSSYFWLILIGAPFFFQTIILMELLAPNFLYVMEGALYDEKKQYERSLAVYDKAIRLDPADPVVYIERAGTYRKMGKHIEEVQDLNKAIELPPRHFIYCSGFCTTRDYARKRLKRLK